MTRVKIELLEEELAGLQLAAGYLQYSMERCLNLIGQEGLPPEQLERLESLTSRFARLADLLIQRVFRLLDDIELTGAVQSSTESTARKSVDGQMPLN